MVNQTLRLDAHDQQIFQLQKEVAEIKTSLKLLQEERLASIEFRKTILDWMKTQDNQFVEDQWGSSGIILPDSKTSSSSKDSSVDLQKLQLSAFNGFEPPSDIPKVNLNLGTHSTPEDLATDIEEEMVLPNPSNNYVSRFRDFNSLPFEATHILGQFMLKLGGSTQPYDRQSTPQLGNPCTLPIIRSGAYSTQELGHVFHHDCVVRYLSRLDWKGRKKKRLCLRWGNRYAPAHKCPEGKPLGARHDQWFTPKILGAYSKVPPKAKVNKSEFEELEDVPTSVIDEPLESPFTTSGSASDVPEDSLFSNLFGVCIFSSLI
ncbi:hypothetical protein R6Q57_003812 [Mikania cordata]